MRIALVIERMETARGGRETSTAQIAARLAAAGDEVTVLCQKGALDAPGVKVQALGSRGLTRTARAKHFIAAAQDTIRRERFDIVHSMLPLPGANVFQLRGGTVPGQVAASLRRRGIVGRLFVRGTLGLNRHRALMGRLEQQVMADPRAHLLPVSRMVADEIREHYGREENVRVVYNAVDVPVMSADERAHLRQQLRFRMGVGSDNIVMLTVANNFALKGVKQAIAAFGRWARARQSARDRLVIVGRDAAAAEGYVRYAGLKNVGHLVHFVAATPDIFNWYCAADLCVLLSWYDPCSRVVLEATRWGVPSITTRFNGASEVLAPGCGMAVASPDAHEEIVAAMEAMSVPVVREKMSQACREASPKLAMDRHVEELQSVYKEIAKTK